MAEPFVSILSNLPTVAADPADVAGLVALGSSLVWPLLRRRRAILAVQVAGSLLFALHYLLLGAATGAAMNVLGALQGIALVVLIDRRRRIGAVAGSMAIGALVASLTWTGLPSLLSLAGQWTAAIGRLQLDTQRLRLWFLVSTVFWCAHNLMVGSAFGLASDMLALGALLLGLWRRRAVAATGLRDAAA
jgi:hypothetical protein